jgi:ATP-dependent DNA helicase RecG
MIAEIELLILMAAIESDRVERTISIADATKFREAICAFANDFPNHRKPGFLLIGVHDKSGLANGLKATDELLRNLAGYRQDGEILPSPAMEVYKITLSDGSGDVVVVEVQPSDLPPVQFRGRVWIRVGPRKAVANEGEERILSERRVATARTFDARPCTEANLEDLALDLFQNTYRKEAIAADVLSANHRDIEEQLAALRFFDLRRKKPTHAAILLFGKNVRAFIYGAYVQYLKIDGLNLSDKVAVSKEFSGDLLTLARELDALLEGTLSQQPIRTTILKDTMVWDYPKRTVRELLMNALCHRNYESNSPVRFYRFADRIEIHNPGGLYGDASPENFPRCTDYRNPILAEALKVLGYVNRFGRGVIDAQQALAENGSAPAIFEFQSNFVLVKIPQHPNI